MSRAFTFSEVTPGGEGPIRQSGLLPQEGALLLLSSVTAEHASGAREWATTVSAVPLTGPGDGRILFTIPHLLPAPTGWDTAPLADGSAALVIEQAGGATVGLAVWGPAGPPEYHLTTLYSMQSFTRPRFTRWRQAPPYLAVCACRDSATLVLFPQVHPGGYDDPLDLAQGASGLLLQRADGFSLFYKAPIPGPPRGNDIMPGRLCHRGFDAAFRPLGETTHPLGETAIYELDAGPCGAEEDALVATTAEGCLVLFGQATATGFEVTRRLAAGSVLPLTSPAVRFLAGDLHVAVLARAETPEARVLHGVIRV